MSGAEAVLRKDAKHAAAKLQCQEYSLLFLCEDDLGKLLSCTKGELTLAFEGL